MSARTHPAFARVTRGRRVREQAGAFGACSLASLVPALHACTHLSCAQGWRALHACMRACVHMCVCMCVCVCVCVCARARVCVCRHVARRKQGARSEASDRTGRGWRTEGSMTYRRGRGRRGGQAEPQHQAHLAPHEPPYCHTAFVTSRRYQRSPLLHCAPQSGAVGSREQDKAGGRRG